MINFDYPERNRIPFYMHENVSSGDKWMRVYDLRTVVTSLDDYEKQRYKARIGEEGDTIIIQLPTVTSSEKNLALNTNFGDQNVQKSYSTHIADIEQDPDRQIMEIVLNSPDDTKFNSKHFNDGVKGELKATLQSASDDKGLLYTYVCWRVVATGTEKLTQAPTAAVNDYAGDVANLVRKLSISQQAQQQQQQQFHTPPQQQQQQFQHQGQP